MPEAAAVLSTALGRTITYQDVPPERFRAQLVSRGMPEWMADGIIAQYHAVLRCGHVSDITHEVPNIVGRPARTFELFARDNAAGLQNDPHHS